MTRHTAELRLKLKLTTALTFGTLLVQPQNAFASVFELQSDQGSGPVSDYRLGQVASPKGDPSTDPKADIIVVGIRGSVASAADKKKNAKQIVDSIVSEDAGKLPDNNVPEALSRVTGVQITRERGQGQDVAIRGLSGVQTTINGNNTNRGQDRSINLADIPAELIKSVDVYKTRTADQVEGSIAGTVNVELRRPLDLAKGLTVAGSLRGSYDDIAKKISPYGSLLVADRLQTGIGEIGVLFNGSLTRTKYLETYIDSESPDTVCCTGDLNTSWGRLPENQRNIIVPYRAQYGLEQGKVDRPSFNAVLQWKPRDNLSFVLEGGYLGSHEERQVDRLFALLREPAATLSNIQLGPDGKIIRGVTLTQATGIPVGIDSVYNKIDSNLYTTNFETHWSSDRAQVNASVQYNWSNVDEYFVEHLTRPLGLTSATVDFMSDQYKGGVPSITLNGVDLGDIASYGVDRFQDNIGQSSNKEFVSQADVTLTLSDASLLRSLQVGTRFNNRVTSRNYGYRDGFPRVNGQLAPLTAFPGGQSATLTGPPIDGAPQWYRIPGAIALDRIGDIRSFIQRTDPGNAARFATEFPSSDQGQVFDSNENTFAVYGQINYAFDLGFPIDGVVGVRYVNTWGTSTSNSFTDGVGGLTVQSSTGRGNFTDVLPSATATLHFTPKLQLRLSYTTNVQRANFYDLRPFYYVNPTAANPTVDAGNPNLKAQREHAFDASAEYFFGRGGQVTFAGYYKKASNFFYFDRFTAQDLAAYGLPGRSGFISQLRNAGDGTFAGLEGTAQSFFDFLPGFGRNFGVSLNASYILKARVEYPYPEDFPGAFDSVNTSKFTGNAALFYDTPKFSTRVAFNYRSPYRLFVWPSQPEYSWYQDRTYRLDAAINYTPVKYLTLSIEGTNLTGNDAYSYFGQQNVLPRGVRIQARTVQLGARFRF
jgi:iron complex outermembrane receptor protein